MGYLCIEGTHINRWMTKLGRDRCGSFVVSEERGVGLRVADRGQDAEGNLARVVSFPPQDSCQW